jgi:hypothetical protein
LVAKAKSLSARETEVEVAEKELVVERTKVSAERTQVTADALKWHEKLKTQAAIAKASNKRDKKLRETKVLLAEWERDLDAREAALDEMTEENAHLPKHQAIQDELDRLKELNARVQADRLGEAEGLVNLVARMSGAFVELGLDPVWFIPDSP